jgi:hypothetical protein
MMYRLWCALVFLVVMVAVAGCSDKNPGAMNQEEVEAFMKKRLKLTEISLVEKPDGGYAGTGKRSNGSKYSLEVRLDKDDKRIEWTTTDENGTVSAGFEKRCR